MWTLSLTFAKENNVTNLRSQFLLKHLHFSFQQVGCIGLFLFSFREIKDFAAANVSFASIFDTFCVVLSWFLGTASAWTLATYNCWAFYLIGIINFDTASGKISTFDAFFTAEPHSHILKTFYLFGRRRFIIVWCCSYAQNQEGEKTAGGEELHDAEQYLLLLNRWLSRWRLQR